MHTTHYSTPTALYFLKKNHIDLCQVQMCSSTRVHDDVIVIAPQLYSSHDRIWNSSSTAITMTSLCTLAQYEMFALSTMSVTALAILLEAFLPINRHTDTEALLYPCCACT